MNKQNIYLNDANKIESNNNTIRIPTYNELFPAIFFNTDGKRSPDEWLARSLINILAELRVMTAAQLFRWIHRSDPGKSIEQIRDFVAELFRHKFIGKMTVKIPELQSKRIRIGENELKTATVIFLNHACQSVLEDHNKRFARFGQPSGVALDRIYHDLLVTEAVLFLSGNCDIGCLKSEDRIKSELRESNQTSSQSVPDFQICLIIRCSQNREATLKLVNGEVIVQSDAADISGKPEGIIFFTANQRAADLIKSLRREKVFLLGDVALPAFAEAHLRDAYDKIFNPESLLLRRKCQQLREQKLLANPIYLKIIYVLGTHGPLTESALATTLDLKRANVSKKLNLLIRKKLLHSEDVQLAPGAQIGRPKKLFAFAETDLSDYHFRVRQLKISLSLIPQK